MKPSNPRHQYYIRPEELTAEIKLKLREISARKHSNYKIAFASILSAIIAVVGAFVIRHFEMQHIKKNTQIAGNSTVELLLRIENIEREVIYMRKITQSDHKLANALEFRLNKLYCEKFQEQCKNQFGYFNGVINGK